MSQAVRPTRLWRPSVFIIVPVLLCALAGSDAEPPRDDPASVLTPQQWQAVDNCVDRASVFLSKRQRADGSFLAPDAGQPAITALCALAFLSRGHLPGRGRYGEQIDRAIDFVLSTQRDDGLFSYREPVKPVIPDRPSHTAVYNHAIAGLLLTEVYGMTDAERAKRIRPAIIRALGFTRVCQQKRKRQVSDKGGWRYSYRYGHSDSDLSVTGWQLMFLRSARNAGFDVPEQQISEAIGYVRRCFDLRRGTFLYGLQTRDRLVSRAMAGAGILSLSLGGMHDTQMARRAGDWLLRHPFEPYNTATLRWRWDRYHYGAYYCSQAMFQLGGQYWSRFFPPLVRTLLENQRPDGSWVREHGVAGNYGSAYTAALVVLTLSTADQLLPIYQR